MTEGDPRPKVAQILYSGLGGHGAVAFGIIGGDRERRWRNALGFVGIEPLLPAYREAAEAAVIEHDYVAAVPRRPWRAWGPLRRWLGQVRPDAILLHSPTMIWPCWLHSRTHRVPLVVVEHQSNGLKSRHDWIASYAAMALADRIVVLSEEYRRAMYARMGRAFQDAKVAVIPNGIDLAAFAGGRPFDHGGALTIGMAGRFTPTKLFPLLIDAFALLPPKVGGRSVLLSLAGAGEALAAAKRRAASSSAHDRIDFTGMLAGEALADWYRGLDVYCHISGGETHPMSIIQAMAAGVPVVGSRVAGIVPLFGDRADQQRGVIVENDAQAIADALAALAADAERARAIGQHGQASVRARFDQRTTFDRYDAVLRAAICSG